MKYPLLSIIVVSTVFAASAGLAAAGEGVVFTGLPVISIRTADGAGVTSRERYVGMSISVIDPSDPSNNISNQHMSDRIRGRGNNTWNSHWALKKSYRVVFREATSLFGLPAARNWALLAQHRDETLLYNAVAFELGRRFGMAFNHKFYFVDVYMDGSYKGNYMLTEHNQAGPGRVDIDPEVGWLAEIDEYYDEDPKFRTAGYNLPIMIKSPRPKRRRDSENPAYDFVKADINALTDAMASPDFPESGYRDLIDIETLAAFLMINEIAANTDLSHPRSTYLYKDKGGLISMGPLWDFDSGYGWNYRNWLESGFNDHFNFPDRRPPVHAFFKRFYEDPVFLARYKEIWNEKRDTIASVPVFIDSMAGALEASAKRNFESWWYKTLPPFTDTRLPIPNDFNLSVAKLKNWYDARVHYINAELNSVEVIPKHKNFDTSGHGGVAFTLVSYGGMSGLAAALRMGDSSAFRIVNQFKQSAAGGGGHMAAISVRPRSGLKPASYGDTLVLSGENQGKPFSLSVPLSLTVPKPPPVKTVFVTPDKSPPTPKGKGWFWRRGR